MRVVSVAPPLLVALLVASIALVQCAQQSPAPVAPPPSLGEASSRVDAVARRCAKLASCAHHHDGARARDPSACVDEWLARSQERAAYGDCLDRAEGCAAVDACMRERSGNAAAAAYCRSHPGEPTGCDGTRLIACSDDDVSESTAVDCASMQAECGETRGAGGLLARGCLSKALCPPGAPEARCEGGAIVTCHDGMIDRTPCAAGARCDEHKASDGTVSVLCESPGHVHCARVGGSWCEGARLVTCTPHGHTGEMRVVDCAAMGMACDASLARPACALPGERACAPSAPRCDGAALSFCAAGRSVKIACDAIGFQRCDPDGHGLEASCATAATAAVTP